MQYYKRDHTWSCSAPSVIDTRAYNLRFDSDCTHRPELTQTIAPVLRVNSEVMNGAASYCQVLSVKTESVGIVDTKSLVESVYYLVVVIHCFFRGSRIHTLVKQKPNQETHWKQSETFHWVASY